MRLLFSPLLYEYHQNRGIFQSISCNQLSIILEHDRQSISCNQSNKKNNRTTSYSTSCLNTTDLVYFINDVLRNGIQNLSWKRCKKPRVKSFIRRDGRYFDLYEAGKSGVNRLFSRFRLIPPKMPVFQLLVTQMA